MATGRAEYLEIAMQTADFLLRELTTPADNGRRKVLHSGIAVPSSSDLPVFRAGTVPGFLDDYALLAHGLLTLYSASGHQPYLRSAI